MTRREQALEAAARAKYEQARDEGSYEGERGPDWDDLAEMYRDGWRRGLAPIIDAVLAVPCDCAERLDREAERIRHSTERWAFGQAYRAAARFLRGES